MAANIIDSLLISLEVDPRDFDRGLEQAEQALNAFERKAMEAGKPVAQIAQEFSNWGLKDRSRIFKLGLVGGQRLKRGCRRNSQNGNGFAKSLTRHGALV